MARAQIFIFDIIIAATAFLVMILVVASLTRPGISPARQEAYSFCLSALESLKANSTLSSVANGTFPESDLNSSLSLLPSRFGYHISVTTHTLSGQQVSTYTGVSGNLSEAELYRDIVAVQSSLVTANQTPLLGNVTMRCWVRP